VITVARAARRRPKRTAWADGRATSALVSLGREEGGGFETDKRVLSARRPGDGRERAADVACGLTCSNRVQALMGREAGSRAPRTGCGRARSKRDRDRASESESWQVALAWLRTQFWHGTHAPPRSEAATNGSG
jgi:hypothetical protein